MVYAQHFQELCDGLPCGVGIEGQATSVATYHPAELGLRVTAPATLHFQPDEFTIDGEAFTMLAACDGATLALFVENAGAEHEAVVERTASGAPLPRVAFDFTAAGRFVVTSMRLEVRESDGPGACTIDDLLVTYNPCEFE